MNFFAGVDVGGTTSTIAICDGQGVVLYLSEQFSTNADQPPAVLIREIVAQVKQGSLRLGIEAGAIISLGLSTPGPATLAGVLLKSPNLKAEYWDRFPIGDELQRAFVQAGLQIQVHYIGDGQAAALGEYSIRTGMLNCNNLLKIDSGSESISSLVMAVVGTGLGGGEVRHGQVVRGKEGRAGHLGHIFLPDFAFRYEHDRRLLVGNAMSTVESAVSLTALRHQLEYRLTLPQWQSHPFNQEPASRHAQAKQLRKLADQGDALALELFDDQARAMGIALLSVNYLGDYDRIVIGGGVCDLSPAVRDRYRAAAEQAYREYALDGFKNLEQLEFSICGDEAPVIGALANVFSIGS